MNICEVVGRIKLTAAALLLSVAFSSTAFADTGGLQVRVTDADGNPVAGASIHASTSDSLTTKSGTTDANGGVRLMGLDPSDDYVVSVTADGFQPARNENVLVVSERTYNLPFALQSVAGAEIEEIVTYGRSDIGQLVDTTSALQSTDVTLDIMDSLPTGSAMFLIIHVFFIYIIKCNVFYYTCFFHLHHQVQCFHNTCFFHLHFQLRCSFNTCFFHLHFQVRRFL